MYLFIVIGHTGQGKSQWTKDFCKNSGKNTYVLDINNEYRGLAGIYPAAHLEPKKFISECMQLKNTNCIFEEATGYFKGNLGTKINQLIIAKRHAQNNYLFLFHSINSVPPQIMEIADFIVLFKTGDEIKTVHKKYTRLFPYFMDLRNKPKFSKHIFKPIADLK